MIAAEPRPSPLPFLGRARAHPNYRLYFAGQGVSLIGTWMTRVATGWLVYRSADDHAVAAALYLAARTTGLGLGRLIVAGTVASGQGLVGLALSPALWLALPMLVAAGAWLMLQLAANTALQTIAEPDKRGRVMAYSNLAFLGVAPFGSLATGAAAGVRRPGCHGAGGWPGLCGRQPALRPGAAPTAGPGASHLRPAGHHPGGGPGATGRSGGTTAGLNR